MEGWTKVDEQTLTRVFTDNALVTVMITDLVGKTSKVEVDVKNIDKQSPEIRGLSDITLVQGETFDPLKGITAYDEQCGEIEDIEVTPAIDTNVPGIYELTYTVSDLAGNITTVKRTVTVNPKEAIVNHVPIIKAEDVTLTVGDNYDPLKGVTASDKEDGDLTKSIEVTETPNHNTSGSNKGSVETGDHTNIGFYASLFAVSILGIVVLTAGKKKVHK